MRVLDRRIQRPPLALACVLHLVWGMVGAGGPWALAEGSEVGDPGTDQVRDPDSGSDSRPTDLPPDLEEILLSEGQELVRTAAFRDQTVEEAPAPILTIDGEMIRASGARTLGEVLERCVGIDPGPGPHLSLRGLGQVNRLGGLGDAGRILLLVDGVRVNDVFADSFSAGLALGVWEIDHIEVMRGPGSALYGGSAFSGVIQVFTHGGRRSGDFEGRARVGGHRAGFEAVVSREVGPGLAMISGRGEVQGPSLGGQERVLEGRTRFESGPFLISGSVVALAIPSGPTAPLSVPTGSVPGGDLPPSPLGLQSGTVALQWERGLSPRLNATASLVAYGKLSSSPDLTFTQQEGRLVGEGRVRFRISPLFWATAGGELRGESVVTPSSEQGGRSLLLGRRIEAGYVQAEVGPFWRTSLTAGARVEQSTSSVDGEDGTRFRRVDPRVALVVQLPAGIHLKVLYGSAFQAPSLSMSYFDSRAGDQLLLSNPALRPELLDGGELEVGYAPHPRFKGRINLYQNDVRDLISPAFTSEEGILRFENVSNARLRGGEGEVTWNASSRVQVLGNLSVIDARDTVDGQPIPLVPRLLVNAGALARPRVGTSLWFSMAYVGARAGAPGSPLSPDLGLDAQVRLDGRVAITVAPGWDLALNVRNILGASSPSIAQAGVYTGPGTEAWMELVLRTPRSRNRSRPPEEETP